MLPKNLILNTRCVAATHTVPNPVVVIVREDFTCTSMASPIIALHVQPAAPCQVHYQHNIMTPPTLSSWQPWDIDDGDTSIAGVENRSVATGTNNELEDTGVDQNETNHQTNQFGIKYTSEQFTETKLLKILHDTFLVSRYHSLELRGKM
jgi:hypothetical protein